MIVSSPLSAVSSSDTTTGKTEKTDAEKKDAALGKNDFLTLLVAQIKAQDPMNPMENTEFTAQMAQFSSLEQLFNVNDNLGLMTTAMNSSTGVSALGLIGREVTAEGQNVHVKGGTASDIAFNLAEPASNVNISVEDQDGNVVRVIRLGTTASGEQKVDWKPESNSGQPLADGLYTFNVVAEDTTGKPVEVQTYTKGIVTGVQYEGSVAYVFIGDLKYMLSEIMEVREAPTATAPTVAATPQNNPDLATIL